MLFVYLFLSMLAQDTSIQTRTLEPCPDKPNCVSTQADSADQQHYIPSVSYTASEADVMQAIKDVLLSKPRSRLKTEETHYLHITYKSRVFGFVDDVQIIIDSENKKLEFRSAARSGHSDMGVNRRRMESFVKELEAKLAE